MPAQPTASTPRRSSEQASPATRASSASTAARSPRRSRSRQRRSRAARPGPAAPRGVVRRSARRTAPRISTSGRVLRPEPCSRARGAGAPPAGARPARADRHLQRAARHDRAGAKNEHASGTSMTFSSTRSRSASARRRAMRSRLARRGIGEDGACADRRPGSRVRATGSRPPPRAPRARRQRLADDRDVAPARRGTPRPWPRSRRRLRWRRRDAPPGTGTRGGFASDGRCYQKPTRPGRAGKAARALRTRGSGDLARAHLVAWPHPVGDPDRLHGDAVALRDPDSVWPACTRCVASGRSNGSRARSASRSGEGAASRMARSSALLGEPVLEPVRAIRGQAQP